MRVRVPSELELTVHAQALVAEGKVHKNAAYPAPLEASYDSKDASADDEAARKAAKKEKKAKKKALEGGEEKEKKKKKKKKSDD